MAARRKPQYRFPWRPGNRPTLLVDGATFFPAMLEAIGGARRYIFLEMYLIASGRVTTDFVDALIEATHRGVQVHLLLDHFGSGGLSRRDRRRLQESDLNAVYYNPIRYGELRRNLFRDHRKLLSVDGLVAFVGGAGLTDDFSGSERKPGWRETMVKVEGPCVADWEALFIETWNLWAGEPAAAPRPSAVTISPGVRGRVTHTRAGVQQEIKQSFLTKVRAARRRVWVSTPYFVPSWKIKRALRKAARRGVDVRLLLPGPVTDHPAVRHAGRRFYTGLLRHGVRILEYQPRFIHSKAVICDGWVSIGSSNIDRWNLRWNLEANQEVDDDAFAEQVVEMFLNDFSHSEELDYALWRRRPWHRRLLEWFWGQVDIWLLRLGRERLRGPRRR